MEKNKDILFQISTMSREFVEKHGLDKSESTRLYLIGEHVVTYWGADEMSGIIHLWEVVLGVDKRVKRLINQNI